MTLFVDREKAFETKFVHEANLDFQIKARRNKLLGHWVAERLVLPQKESDPLIASYTIQGVLSRDAQSIVAKAVADLDEAGSADMIHAKLNEFAAVARQQIGHVGT